MANLTDRLAKLSPAQRALLEKRLATKVQSPSQTAAPKALPIAIVGMSARFAGAPNLDAYWRLIRDGIEGVADVPADRWPVDEFYVPGGAPGKTITRRGAFLDQIDQFDPTFFGVTPREAARMDPQQRILLEVAWEALENGLTPPDRLAGSATGVFVGIGGADYAKIPSQLTDFYERIDAHMGTGNALSIAANRISYALDLRGPSLSVDTACSSSSLAIHLAVESLRRGECAAALAGGVNAILTPETTIAFSQAHMLSPEGRCRPFDAGANGYVRGEGCGLVYLKRLADAEAAGDPIVAVLLATAANQDGRTSGISAPNGERQKACIRTAHDQAGLTPADIDYIEAHGTSTPLGDPIEMQALTEVFSASPTSNGEAIPPVRVTSVKANIGHTETVSGVAGLIKTALLMKHAVVPPQLHLESLNPHIQLDGSRITIPREAEPWAAGPRRRVAGISSFGFGGTNTHLLVAEAPTAMPSATTLVERATHLVKLTAKNPDRLAEQARGLNTWLEQHPEAGIGEIAYTMNAGRCDFNHRIAIPATDLPQLTKRLDAVAGGESPVGIHQGKASGLSNPNVAWLFTGQGSQRAGMGHSLYQTEPTFRDVIDRCDAALSHTLEDRLLDILYGKGEADTRVNETRYTQPALFAVECALAALWGSWGVRPDILLGHSIGEYAAAVTAGVFSLEEGVQLVAERARLMHAAPGNGKMAVLFTPEADVARAIQGREAELSVAAVNGPANTVLSGEAAAVEEVFAQFEAEGVKGQMLVVSHGFHSPLMDPVLDEFERFAEGIAYQTPRLPIASNLTGQLMTEAPTARFWRDHLRGTVRFADGVACVAQSGATHWIEMGPAPVLLGMAQRCEPEVPRDTARWLPSMRAGQNDGTVLTDSLAAHYAAGGSVDWRARDRGRNRRVLSLPNYPFDQSRCWHEGVDSTTEQTRIASARSGSPVLGGLLPVVGANQVHEVGLSPSTPPYLADHQVQGSVVTPGALYLEQALAALAQRRDTPPSGALRVDQISIKQAMFLATGQRRRVQVTLSPESNGLATLEVYSTLDDQNAPSWAMHASAQLVLADNAQRPTPIDLADCRSRMVDNPSHKKLYQLLNERGLEYGEAFSILNGVDRTDHDAVAPVRLTDAVRAELPRYQLHPVLGDAMLQTIACTSPFEPDGSYCPDTYVPVAIRSARLHEPTPTDEPLFTYAVRTSPVADSTETSPETIEADAYLVREDGTPVASLLGVRVQRLGAGASDREVDLAEWLYRTEWPTKPTAERSPVESGTWLLFADRTGLADQLVQHVEGEGGTCVVVRPGNEFAVQVIEQSGHARTEITFDPMDASHYERLLEVVLASPSAKLAAVVHLMSLDLLAKEQGEETWNTAGRLGVGSVMRLLQKAARRGLPSEAGCWIVTRGAQPVLPNEPVSPSQAATVGFSRVAQMEHPELSVRLCDLDPNEDNLQPLVNAIAAAATGDLENQIAYRKGHRHVARLVADTTLAETIRNASDGAMTLPSGSPYQLRVPRPGSFDGLRYEPIQRSNPAEGQIELEVHAAGLNFSDVLKALGLYPGVKDSIVPLGIEASGVVTAVGPGVEHLRVGDEAMGVAPYAFGSHTTTAGYAMVPKPSGMTHDEACTVPVTFLTAHHALVRLAQLERGERVLIHAGAGGVGLAAIQIAQHRGAEVFATAGSDEKRDLLRSLGVQHVMNSRTLDFVEEIREATDREGVDVVLNSLPGEAIPASLGLLKAYGRFLEIGKIDIYQDRKLGLLPFQDNLSYFAIDLDRVLRERPDYVRGLFAEVMQHFTSGDYRPLPRTRFPVEQTAAAFRYMSQRKNIGKVVVDVQSDAKAADKPTAGPFHRDAGYLVTGGLGALGQRVADWLVDQGAGGVVLLSRRAPSDQVQEELNRLAERGSQVVALQGDVTDAPSLDAALRSLPAGFPPLRGVIHAAGVLDDGLLADMTDERLERVLHPKTVGAWNLHQATLAPELPFGEVDRFVLFSSIAAVLGSPGQANYAAANTALDALAHLRRSQGLSATSINWGPFDGSQLSGEGGMASGDNEEAVRQKGMGLIDADAGLTLMGRLLTSDATPAQLVAIDARWDAMSRLLSGRRMPLVEGLLVDGDASAGGSKVDSALRAKLIAASAEDRRQQLEKIVRDELARVMSVEPEQLDPEQPLAAMGLDSLMSLELKNNLEAKLDFTLPMAKLLEGPSITSLAEVTGDVLTASSSGDDAPAEWTPFITLRPGSNDPAAKDQKTDPLFFLPALGGDALCYRDLQQKLATNRPLLAFRPRGLDDDAPPHEDLQELVDDYVAAIRTHQSQGPYHLAGWSTGGVTSFAVAERLEALGEEVAMLALFDTPLPSVYDGIDTDDEAGFLVTVADFAAHFMGIEFSVTHEWVATLPAEERFATVLAAARRAGMFSDAVSDDYVRRMAEVGEALVRASQKYTPKPIAGSVHFFAPEVPGALAELAPVEGLNETGWKESIGQTLACHAIPGDHFTMMTKSGAEQIARVLDSLL